MLLIPGHWYRSKQALEHLGPLRLVDPPHATPDGAAVLVFDAGGRSLAPSADGRPPSVVESPPCLVPQGGHGHDLRQLAGVGGQPAIRRVEIPVDALGDLEPLVEYDHLPEPRKDYSVYPRGHKLR